MSSPSSSSSKIGVPLALLGLLSARRDLIPCARGVEAEVDADGLLVRLSDMLGFVYRWRVAPRVCDRGFRLFEMGLLYSPNVANTIYKVRELAGCCEHQDKEEDVGRVQGTELRERGVIRTLGAKEVRIPWESGVES